VCTIDSSIEESHEGKYGWMLWFALTHHVLIVRVDAQWTKWIYNLLWLFVSSTHLSTSTRSLIGGIICYHFPSISQIRLFPEFNNCLLNCIVSHHHNPSPCMVFIPCPYKILQEGFTFTHYFATSTLYTNKEPKCRH